MAAKSLLLFSILGALSFNLQADELVKAHLNQQLVKATMDYEETFELCEAAINNSEGITLPVSELAKRKITLRELHFAIVYFRDKAQEECSSRSRDKLISAILNSNAYSADSPNDPIDPERSGLSLLLPSQHLLEARVLYVQLDRKKTELLETIFEGSSPALEKISNWQEAANRLRKD